MNDMNVCNKRRVSKSKVTKILSKLILESKNGSLSRTEMFTILAEISKEMENYFEENTTNLKQLNDMLNMFFSKDELCLEIDNILIGFE